MKVLLTHERFLPDFGGGGEYIVEQTALNLVKRGVDLQVLTTGDPRLNDYQGITITRLPVPRYLMNAMVRRIAAMAAEVDLIHTFNYQACLPSLIAGAWLGKPVICTCLGLFGDAWLAMRGQLVGRAIRAWERFLLTRSYTRLLFLSDYSRVDGLALGVQSQRAGVALPGFLTGEFGPAPERRDIVLFAGKYEVRKGVFDVLEVARALPEVRFRMIGWGPEKETLRRSAPPNVEIGEKKTGAAYRDELAHARIFFMPSKAETFGIALLEAMASGCAVVSSVPLEFAGVRTRASDPEAMIAAIRNLWESPEECRRLGRRNVELAASYTWDRYTDSVLATYRGVLAGPSPATGIGGMESCL